MAKEKLNYEVIVLGGGPAGVTAATTVKRHYPDKKVLLLRKIEKALIPCGIPYMFGLLKDPTQNINPDSVLKSRGIDLLIDEAVEVFPEKREIVTSGGRVLSYERLIWATGSRPFVPPIPGINLENVFTIQKDFSHLLKIKKELETAKNVVIVGGGFIGVEFAEVIKKHYDMEVTIVEVLPYILYGNFDEEFCFEAERELEKLNIKIYASTKVVEFKEKNGKVSEVVLENGETIPADVVLVSTGVRPNTELAEKAGLKLAEDGSILVDRTMRTSFPEIFGCGDCVEKKSFFNGRRTGVRLASVAAMEARIAGANLFVTRRINPGTIGVFSTKIGDRVFACAGLTEEKALKEGFDIVIGDASSPDKHPSALPNTKDLHVKLIFDKYSGTLLGGQVSGSESAAELINLISACLLHKMTASEMAIFQMGTHPLLTSSPPGYPLSVAAELASIEIIKS